MREVFYAISAVAGIIMVIMILLQQQGSGLGVAYGGDSGSFRSKRGAEKVVFNLTIISATVFVLALVLGLLSKA
jgi:preprotein translocase subunit SecG